MATAYTITITNPSLAAPNDGFIDSKRLEQYGSPAGNNVTYVQAQAKKRGNFRYSFILESVAIMANPYVDSAVTTGAAINAEGTSFQMIMRFDSDSYVSINRNGTTLTGVDAIKQLVSEALTIGDTRSCQVYYPAPTFAVNGPLQIGALAANLATAQSLVTVTSQTI